MFKRFVGRLLRRTVTAAGGAVAVSGDFWLGLGVIVLELVARELLTELERKRREAIPDVR